MLLPTRGAGFCVSAKACPDGYNDAVGDLPGSGDPDAGGSTPNVASIAACATLCSANSNCGSFEWSPTEKACNRHTDSLPTLGRFGDYSFCSNAQRTKPVIVSKGKPTSQSSEGWGGQSSRAVDGNTDGSWNHGSCTHTLNTVNPWWKVDLQWNYAIDKVARFRTPGPLVASPAYRGRWFFLRETILGPRKRLKILYAALMLTLGPVGACTQAGLCRMSSWTVSCAAQLPREWEPR